MNLRRKNKFVLLSTIIIGCFLLAACSNTSDNGKIDDGKITRNPMLENSAEELIFKSEHIDHKSDYEIPYINYDEFFLKDGEENPTTGRYANVTKDGKINWNVEETARLDYTPIAKEMLSKVTLDGEKKVFPIKFEDIDKEFSVFDTVDFTKLTDDMYPFTITDVKNGNKLFSYSHLGEDFRTVYILNKENIPLLSVEINTKKNIIIGLSNEDAPYMAIKNLMVDGIGAGNTLNEVYEKFGMPKGYYLRTSVLPIISYRYKDDQKMYAVLFYYDDEFFLHSMDVIKMKNNVITAVSVYYNEIE